MLSIIADAMGIATGQNNHRPDHRDAEMRRRYLAKQQNRIDTQRQRDITRISGHW